MCNLKNSNTILFIMFILSKKLSIATQTQQL